MVTDVLHGSQNKRIRELGFNMLSTHGLLRDYSEQEIKSFIKELLSQDYIKLFGDEYPILKLTEKAYPVLKGKKSVEIKVRSKSKKVFKKKNIDENPILFNKLRELRLELAKSQDVPPYIILSDKSLHEICNNLPTNEDELILISGIGFRKLELYGEDILKVVKDYLSSLSDINRDVNDLYR